MADDATQEVSAEAGQLSATATANQPTVATTFHLFAFLPEEIRRMIWQQACFPTRMHYLEFPKTCTLPPVRGLSDPADAPLTLFAGVRDDLAVLIANSENYQQEWSVPGCKKFRKFYHRRDLNRVGAVCPESREAYLNLVNHNRVAIKKGVHVNESFDIFHFSCSPNNWRLSTFLLNMRPRLRPTNIAIDIDFGPVGHGRNFLVGRNQPVGDGSLEAVVTFPRWLSKAIEWGREAKEGYKNSPTTTLAPSIDDVAINLQDLQAIFLVHPRIKLRPRNRRDAKARPSTTGGDSSTTRPGRSTSLPMAHQYNCLVHGMHRRFYGLSPENEEIMKHWDVPEHVWPVLRETKAAVGSSEDWKINIYLMASIEKKGR